jgi:hypothetical protein
MSLPDDISRCRDHECPQAPHCRRYIERDSGGSRVVGAFTLFPYETLQIGRRSCPFFIEEEKTI